MIINADSLVPHLTEKVRPTKSDDSRHLLCPHCAVRTKLNTLGDGRRKCTVCGKKFRIHKLTEKNTLQQCAEILLCFCIDFSAHKTAEITGHRYRLVARYYDHFRRLLFAKSLPQEKMPLRSAYPEILEVPREKSWCIWCKSRARTGAMGGRTPVFGVQFRKSGEVYLDQAPGSREGYAGFICCGKFQCFMEDAETKENTEKLWAWIREQVRTYHGLWKRNRGFYLKELEWKYNCRSLQPDLQARKFIELMPSDFLSSWLFKTEGKLMEACRPPSFAKATEGK